MSLWYNDSIKRKEGLYPMKIYRLYQRTETTGFEKKFHDLCLMFLNDNIDSEVCLKDIFETAQKTEVKEIEDWRLSLEDGNSYKAFCNHAKDIISANAYSNFEVRYIYTDNPNEEIINERVLKYLYATLSERDPVTL